MQGVRCAAHYVDLVNEFVAAADELCDTHQRPLWSFCGMGGSTRCLKITEKVSFNNYVYILSGQKLIKNAKNGPFWRVFSKTEACGQTVLADRSVLIGQKLVKNAKIQKFKFDIFE